MSSGHHGVGHARNARRVELFNAELQEAVTNAQAELVATLKQQYGLALINARLQLAHDLHDGLGGSLLHIMATVEQNPQALQRGRVLSMLKLLRDDLRQTLDTSSREGMKAPTTPKEWIASLRHCLTITSEPGKTLLKARLKFAGNDLQHQNMLRYFQIV